MIGSGFTKKNYSRGAGRVAPKPTHDLRKPAIPAQADAIEKSAAVVVSPSDSASRPMTTGELLSRAKRSIDSCETPLRAAAEDIARAYEQGATQREVAQGVGKSPAWVNRLLKWRSSGYEGTAFGDKLVQGVNKSALPVEAASSDSGLASADCLALGKNGSASSGRERLVEPVKTLGSSEAQEKVHTAPTLAQATKMLSAAHASGDHHLPAGCNRQDPFQRLAEQWSSCPFRDLLLNSPKASQDRFLREVLLKDMGCDELIIPVVGIDANAVNTTAGEAT